MDINPILQAIDHCLEDWSVSPDAMRWTLEPHPSSTSQWATLGYTTTPIQFGPIDLRPYLDALDEHIRLLAVTVDVPVHLLGQEPTELTTNDPCAGIRRSGAGGEADAAAHDDLDGGVADAIGHRHPTVAGHRPRVLAERGAAAGLHGGARPRAVPGGGIGAEQERGAEDDPLRCPPHGGER